MRLGAVRAGAAAAAVCVLVAGLWGIAPRAATAYTPTLPASNTVTGFGDASAVTAHVPSAKPLVGIAARPNGDGFWAAAADGGVFAHGGAPFRGSVGGTPLNAPIVGIAATPTGNGYWLAASDGGVFAFGDASFRGSMGGRPLNAPIVGIGRAGQAGYYLVASDGGVFAFGDATFQGSMGGQRLNRPIVGMAGLNPAAYYLVASDGGVFAFGGAPFSESLGSVPLNQPIVGMAVAGSGAGSYYLVAADGGVFALDGAPFHGSHASTPPSHPAVGIAPAPNGKGYWIAYGRTALAPRIAAYAATRSTRVTAAVLDLTTGETTVYRPDMTTFTASTLKVDILATLLATRPLTQRDRDMAAPMIQESANAPASAFYAELGAGRIGQFQRAAGLASTTLPGDGTWGRTTTTALDRVAMMKAVALPNPLLTDEQRAYILSLMESVVPSQRWGATGGVPPEDTAVALKNGFVGQQINTMGWVRGRGRNYLIAVLTDGNPSWDYGIETTTTVSAIAWSALAP